MDYSAKTVFFRTFLLCAIAMNVNAQQALEKLVMPGPLTEKHAEFEDDCTKCHRPFSKVEQSSLCRECHEEIDQDINAGSGFHGRAEGIKGRECSTCHSEHKGRDADTVLLNDILFDHNQTDFELFGSHKQANCQSCHQPKKSRLDTPKKCVACHGEEEPHEGQFDNKCTDCHSEDSWLDIEFDHKKTDFALLGSHKDTRCVACHGYDNYQEVNASCVSCHHLNDVHVGRLGDKCQQCHDEETWKEQKFNHAKEADFPLRGKHAEIDCTACHKTNSYKDELSRTCIGCHKSDDPHFGRNGEKCAECHRESSWKKNTFDHDQQTSFSLAGEHKKLSCQSCHKQPAATHSLDSKCISCHNNDDVHNGALGAKCDECHRPTGWKLAKFDHGKETDFALAGSHEKLECRDCHLPEAATMELEMSCVSCHEQDDAHGENTGDQCDRCHNERGWSESVIFDHDVTRFPLVGLHAVSACEQCHTDGTYGKVSSDCSHCHSDDDPHRGNLGQQCQQCHNPNDWLIWQFEHQQETDFPLTGQHNGLDCLACHKTPMTQETSLRDDCYSCHRKDDAHRGAFGRDCGQCHSSESFSDMEIIR